MAKIVGRRVGAVVGLGLWLAACGGSSKTPEQQALDRICEPGTRLCDGLNVRVCSDDGTERTIEKTCLPSQTCADGACAETSCVPNTRFCQDGSVWKCDSTGGGSKLAQACAKSQFCREADDSASCSNQACDAGQKLCDGDRATTCEADGSGPSPGGKDCAEKGQGCANGDCHDLACSPGEKLCQGGDVYLCGTDGSATSLLADCQASDVCDGEKTACVPKVCEVGAIGCDGTRAVKCNPYGSAWEPTATDCAAENKVCVAGECKKQTCVPDARFCQDGSVFSCDKNGVASTLWQTCNPSYQHCGSYPSSNYATCDYNACEPNLLLCDGNVARTCNPDGTWPSGGTDCGLDQYCDSGTCHVRECEPYSIFCKDGAVWSCDWLGAAESLYTVCPAETVCQVASGNYQCVPRPCSPGQTACLSNQIGKCASDGQSLSQVTSDCTTAGNVCGADNVCAKSVVDTLGVAEDALTEYAGNVVGDVIKVSSARKLTELQLNVVLASPREIRWIIYEQSGNTFIARIDKVVPNQTGTGFISSGPLSYTLKAGKTYLVAAAISGGNSIAYYDAAPFTLNLSFGTLLGRVEANYAANLYAYVDQSYLYQMKVTTEAP